MGNIERFDAKLKSVWQMHLAPPMGEFEKGICDEYPHAMAAADLLAADQTPTARMTGWGNAASEPAALDDNLLGKTPVFIQALSNPPSHGEPQPWEPTAVLSNSFGFGGHNGCLILLPPH